MLSFIKWTLVVAVGFALAPIVWYAFLALVALAAYAL